MSCVNGLNTAGDRAGNEVRLGLVEIEVRAFFSDVVDACLDGFARRVLDRRLKDGDDVGDDARRLPLLEAGSLGEAASGMVEGAWIVKDLTLRRHHCGRVFACSCDAIS